MTIGMLMESLGSKAGALGGHFVDATPFQRADGKARTTPWWLHQLGLYTLVLRLHLEENY